VHFHILRRARAWVAKKSTADCDCAPGLFSTLLVDHPQGARFHAVDAPRRVALLVADGDGEAAVVGSHQVDLLPLLALDFQARTLAPVLRPPLRTVSLGKGEEKSRQWNPCPEGLHLF
jgi:hypothetical protein